MNSATTATPVAMDNNQRQTLEMRRRQLREKINSKRNIRLGNHAASTQGLQKGRKVTAHDIEGFLQSVGITDEKIKNRLKQAIAEGKIRNVNDLAAFLALHHSFEPEEASSTIAAAARASQQFEQVNQEIQAKKKAKKEMAKEADSTNAATKKERKPIRLGHLKNSTATDTTATTATADIADTD
jgi:hypothetical protein